MPSARAPALQAFLTATEQAIAARTGSTEAASAAARAMQKVGAALASPVTRRTPPVPTALPACEHLPMALRTARSGPADLARIADAFSALAPALVWRRGRGDDEVFQRGHASTDLIGPADGALEQRPDVRVGISLLAPGIIYPDHQHPPEEVYLALSDSDWRQNDNPWHAPGLGGIVYNPPDIIHAMRARRDPLFAIWCLPVSA